MACKKWNDKAGKQWDVNFKAPPTKTKKDIFGFKKEIDDNDEA